MATTVAWRSEVGPELWESFGFAVCRGLEDQVNIGISHDPINKLGTPENSFCRIFVFRWSLVGPSLAQRSRKLSKYMTTTT